MNIQEMLFGSSNNRQQPADKSDKSAVSPKMWADGGGVYWGATDTVDKLPPGFYQPAHVSSVGFCLRSIEVSTDDLLVLPDPVCDLLLKEFVEFWERGRLMRARGFSLKRGLFIHGAPGGGKTSAIQRMAKHMIDEMGGIVVIAESPSATGAGLHLIRKIEPERPIICVFEDIDAMMEEYGEAEILSLLDGELQISNVVNVATCNYPELLDPRVKNRPGRFDRLVEVSMPSEEARRSYFQQKAPELDPERLERWVKVSDGWSVAHLREMVVATLILEEKDEDVIGRLKMMHEEPPTSEKYGKKDKFGFKGT